MTTKSVRNLTDVAMAKLIGSSLSGHTKEWPQLKPLLLRLADAHVRQENEIVLLRNALSVYDPKHELLTDSKQSE